MAADENDAALDREAYRIAVSLLQGEFIEQ